MDSNLLIGQKIKKQRTNKKMTIKELAAAANITSSMLSQIEHGQANPSLNTIRLLSSALGEPLFRLFMDDSAGNDEIVRFENRRHVIDKGVDYEMLTPDFNGSIEMLLLKLKAHSMTTEEPLSHEGEEIAVVTEGTLNVCVDGEWFTLNKGDSIRIRGGVLHTWENVSDEAAELIFAVSPPTF